MLREMLTAIVNAAGESMDAVNAEIMARRIAGATPAPEFTLPTQSGARTSPSPTIGARSSC